MDLKQLEEAIISAIEGQFNEFKTVDVADVVERENVKLPAFFIDAENIEESPLATPEETHYSVEFSAVIVCRTSQKKQLKQKLLQYVDFINRNDWGLTTEAMITGSGKAEMQPEQKDLYIWQINFTHYLKP